MNSIPGISFYDALTKLAVGFLLTWWLPCLKEVDDIIPYSISSEIRTTLYLIFCFVIGILYCNIFAIFNEWLSKKLTNTNASNKFPTFVNICVSFIGRVIINNTPMGKRNYPPYLCSELEEKCPTTGITEENVEKYYLKAYYKVQHFGLMGNIPVLEGLEAFLRFNFPIMICYVVIITYQVITEECFSMKCFCCRITVTIIVTVLSNELWFCTWNRIQCKIHSLIWEANKYLEEINK